MARAPQWLNTPGSDTRTGARHRSSLADALSDSATTRPLIFAMTCGANVHTGLWRVHIHTHGRSLSRPKINLRPLPDRSCGSQIFSFSLASTHRVRDYTPNECLLELMPPPLCLTLSPRVRAFAEPISYARIITLVCKIMFSEIWGVTFHGSFAGGEIEYTVAAKNVCFDKYRIYYFLHLLIL